MITETWSEVDINEIGNWHLVKHIDKEDQIYLDEVFKKFLREDKLKRILNVI